VEKRARRSFIPQWRVIKVLFLSPFYCLRVLLTQSLLVGKKESQQEERREKNRDNRKNRCDLWKKREKVRR